MRNQPDIGQLLYQEDLNPNGEMESCRLLFIDEEPKDNAGWNYTQIVYSELENGKEMLYGGIEAGGGLSTFTRVATDEDINHFFELFRNKQYYPDTPGLDEWLNSLKSDEILLNSEKERVFRLAKS